VGLFVAEVEFPGQGEIVKELHAAPPKHVVERKPPHRDEGASSAPDGKGGNDVPAAVPQHQSLRVGRLLHVESRGGRHRLPTDEVRPASEWCARRPAPRGGESHTARAAAKNNQRLSRRVSGPRRRCPTPCSGALLLIEPFARSLQPPKTRLRPHLPRRPRSFTGPAALLVPLGARDARQTRRPAFGGDARSGDAGDGPPPRWAAGPAALLRPWRAPPPRSPRHLLLQEVLGHAQEHGIQPCTSSAEPPRSSGSCRRLR